MTSIIIIGAGFGGLTAALGLDRQFRNRKDITITLIDKHDYQLFAPNLFEAATSEEEFVSQKDVAKSITLPIREALQNSRVQFLRGEVLSINPQEKKVVVQHSVQHYDYLIMSTGSTTDYFGIQGAQEHSMPLKSLQDAFRIRNAVEFAVQQHRQDAGKKVIKVVIAGGGYTGVELAGEMKGLLDILSWKYNYPREKLELVIIEASPKLIMGLSDHLSADAYARLKDLGVTLKVSSPITKVDDRFLEFLSGERLEHDVLIWTTGVKGFGGTLLPDAPLDRKQRFQTTPYLQLQNYPYLFAIGDCACVLCPNGTPMPPTAQDALQHARYIARVIPFFMKNKKPAPFVSQSHGFIINIGGKWAVLSSGQWYITGLFAYIIDKAAHTRYYHSFMGLWKAFKYTWKEVRNFSKND